MLFEPKKLQPGFLKRSIINSFDLFFRSPFIFLSVAIIYILYCFFLVEIKLPTNASNILSIFFISFLFNFSIYLSMYSDKYKISFELYFQILVQSIKGYLFFINQQKIMIIFILLISLFFSQPFDKDKMNLNYYLCYTLFDGVLLFFSGQYFSQFLSILYEKINEKNNSIKESIIKELLKKSHNLNFIFSNFQSLIPITVLFICLSNIFIVQFILFLFIPIYIYITYREMFEGIDKNQKAFEVRSQLVKV